MTVRALDTPGSSSAAHGRRPARHSPETAPLPPAAPLLAPMGEWPLRSYRELRGLPVSVRSARLHARKVLCKWHIGVITDTVELLVSEITTNAVRTSPRVRLWLTSDRRSVLIQVWDGDHHQPRCRNTGPDAEAGRGLMLVEALSARWGWYAAGGPAGKGPAGEGQSGKVVWALCAE